MSARLPIIDVSPLFGQDGRSRLLAARAIGAACEDHGFFYARGHGIAERLIAELDVIAREFFAVSEAEKTEIAMRRGGRAWRGYFPVGGELTSGKADLKEGIYFGSELSADDPRVVRGLPLHGPNLFPDRPRELRRAVTQYMAAASLTAHAVMEGLALSLDLDANYFRHQYTADPTVLFRIFHYPNSPLLNDQWGVGEHTDYGLLTLLHQDDAGGLEVKTRQGWIEVPPVPGTLVCNIGDMLDRLTAGFYKSTPHRARNQSGRSRISFAFFFDPGFDAKIIPLPQHKALNVQEARWDGANVHDFHGTYGAYLLDKVAKVFPQLVRDVIES